MTPFFTHITTFIPHENTIVRRHLLFEYKEINKMQKMAVHWFHLIKLISLKQQTENCNLKTTNRNSTRHHVCSSCITLIIII